MVRRRRKSVAVVWLLHLMQLPTQSSSQQSLYTTCYACGCQTCEVGDLEGRIPIPDALRDQVGGFSEISCFQMSQAGLAGLIPPDICNLNKSRELQQACQCPPLPPALAPTDEPTILTKTTQPSDVPSAIVFDQWPSIAPTNNAATPNPSILPFSTRSLSPSGSKASVLTQSPSNEPSMKPKEKTNAPHPQAIPAAELPVFDSVPVESIAATESKKMKNGMKKSKDHSGKAIKPKKRGSGSAGSKKSEKHTSEQSRGEKSGKGHTSHGKRRRKRMQQSKSSESDKHEKLWQQRRLIQESV